MSNITYTEVYPAQRTPAWHAFRTGRLTASVAAAALGKSPWASPKKAYRQILGLEPHVSNYYMEHGREMEPVARALYARRSHAEVVETGFWERSDCHWLGASPDALVNDDGCLEIKVSRTYYADLPEHWRIQAQVQLLCTGRDWCDVFHWFDGFRAEWTVRREGLDDLLYRLKCWYDEFPMRGVEPPRRKAVRHGKKT
jgi:putative phage-type endonuclease